MSPSQQGAHAAAQHAAETVVHRLTEAGHTAYFAGGCVRDMLLERPPVDYDIATSARPDAVLALYPDSVTTGKCFGVVRVRPDAHHEIEVATFRGDHGYQDGRHPTSITFTDAREDAQRRDFTINALFYDPINKRVLDFVEGRADLERGILRCVGEPAVRFTEDRLRLLRAVRFAAVLGFTVEPTTAGAVRAAAADVTGVAAERIRIELSRLLVEAPHAGRALMLLDALGLLAPLLPEVKAMQGVEQPPAFHPEGDVFIHTALMLDLMEHPSPRLAWSVLLHDIGKPPTQRVTPERIRFDRHANVGADMAERILKRLRFPSAEIQAIVACVAGHMRTMDVKHMRRATLRRMVGGADFDTELELHRLDCLASHGDLENYRFLADFRAAMRNEPVLPPPWVTGRDLLTMGMREGPELGRLLRAAYDAQLDGRAADRAALLAWLEPRVRQSGGY